MIAKVFYNNAGTHVLKFNVLVMVAFQRGIEGTVVLGSES